MLAALVKECGLERQMPSGNMLDIRNLVKIYPRRRSLSAEGDFPTGSFVLQTGKDIPFWKNRSLKSGNIVLSGINLSLNKGDRLALVGASASGKSTLAKIILGLEPISVGEIFYRGEKICYGHKKSKNGALKKLREETGLILQDPRSSFDPRMDMVSSVAEPLWGRQNIETAKEAAEELLDLVGLDSRYCKSYPHQLSGGQLQRAAIARAMVSGPKLLIADEMLSALDPGRRKEILDLFTDTIIKRPDSLIFIAHDLTAVKYLCNKIAVINHGEIVEYGDISLVLSKPQHPYTLQLVQADAALNI